MLWRKLFRTAWNYKSQFISMMLMIAIGIGVFVGFNMEWYSLDKDVMTFLDETEYADFRIYNEKGFTEQEIEAIQKIDGVDAASRVLAVNVSVDSSEDALALFSLDEYVVSKMMIIKGEEYNEEKAGFWISDKYAEANDISPGDEMTLVYRGMKIKGEILGLVKSAEYLICVADENQLMPEYESFGFVYVSPELLKDTLGMEFYPQINILSDLTKAKLEDEIKEAIGRTTLVLSKEEHYSYAGAMSEIEEGQTMGSILPVLFLAIAILTMTTTMHRITANEKTQIGTLKALGFRDAKILRHYTSYGLVLGLFGTIPGVVLGFFVAGLIINENGMMGTYLDMPYWDLIMPELCWLVLALVILFMTLISYLSVKKVMKGTAAETLRPYAPKKMKAMLIEKTRLWEKLSFSVKWNFRDVMRHKARSFMTIFGVTGCMILLVGGLGMKDTMDSFLQVMDEEIFQYTTRVNIVESADNEEIVSFADEIDGDWVAASSIKIDDRAVTMEIYDMKNETIHFIDEENNRVDLEDNGAYICIRLADKYKVGDVIEFSPYGGEETYSVKIAGILRSVMTENIVMTKEYAEEEGIPYQISSVFTEEKPSGIKDANYISGKQTKETLMNSFDSFTEIMDIMVLVLVFAAIILGIVVLYNLGVMSYVERSRELATLKVVGFRDKHIGQILISQNIWLTLVGVLIGLPSGVGVLYILVTSLVSEYELKLTLGALTYAVSLLVAFGVSMFVSLLVSRKNKEIDMV